MIIAGLQKTTLLDYPKKVAAIIFLAGCNFRCPWCYSSELVLPSLIKMQPVIAESEVLKFLKSRQGLLDGVVICGGEPTINRELPELLKKIKDLGFLVKLDTNGSNPLVLKRLIDNKLIDYVAMDIKFPMERYREVFFDETKTADIAESVTILKESGLDHEFRTTVAPGVLDERDFLAMAEWVGDKEKGKYYLQQYKAIKTIDPEYLKKKPDSPEYLNRIKNLVSPYFAVCEVR